MVTKRKFSVEEARLVGDELGINWHVIDLEQFRRGLEVELEHGTSNTNTNVTDDDPLLTGKIAWAHLNEISDYYTRLEKMEGYEK